MRSLPVFLMVAGRPVILTGAGHAADAKRRLLERAGAHVVGEEDGEARLAIVSDGDAATVARLRARGILVNATDHPHLCDFLLPAIIDRDPVIVAIGTAGASAGLAKALRQRLEGLLPATLGRLADGLQGARAGVRARWPDAAARRRAIDAALAQGGPLDPLGEAVAGAVDQWLEREGEGRAPDGLVRLRFGSPDPDEMSVRAARLLGAADRIHHHPLVPAAILDRARADAVRVPAETPPDQWGSGVTLWLEMADEACPGGG
ncbi:MAG: siroheme synthase [Sphingobium sp.]